MLAVSDLAKGNLALGVTKRCDIDHQTEGIAALRRNEHTYPLIVAETKYQACLSQILCTRGKQA